MAIIWESTKYHIFLKIEFESPYRFIEKKVYRPYRFIEKKFIGAAWILA